MRLLKSIVMAALLSPAGGASLDGDTMEAKGKKVHFKVQSGYCERAEGGGEGVRNRNLFLSKRILDIFLWVLGTEPA